MNIDRVIYKFNKILFEKLPKEIGDKCSIAGGALRDSLINEKIKDIDIFCQDQSAVLALEEWFKKQPNVKILNGNEVLSNFLLDGHWFQIIRDKYFDLSSDELIKKFDFTICGIMMNKNEIRVLPTFYEDLVCKRLRINNILYPLSTLERLQKYIKKGYTACNGTLLEITRGLQTVNLDNPDEDSLRFYPDGTPRFLGVD